MSLGQSLEGTSLTPGGPFSYPAIYDTPGFPKVRSARHLELSGDHDNRTPKSLQAGIRCSEGRFSPGVEILNGALI